MTRRVVAILLAAIAIAAAACAGEGDEVARVSPTVTSPTVTSPAATTVQGSPTPSPTVPAMVGVDSSQPSGDRAFRHVQELAGRIGVRVAGTAAEQRSAEYIEAQLRDYGYQVERQPFTFKSFVSRSVELSAAGQPLKVAPLTNSSPGKVSNAAFFAGLGRPADYPSGGIAGKVALVERGELTFSEKARNAVAAGASALVVYEPGAAVVAGSLADTPPGIPVLSIEGADGERLRKQIEARQPVTIDLSFAGGVEDVPAMNVIGRPGDGACRAVAGSHFDSVERAPGASDNASGTGAMLELARVQALRGNSEGVCFIAFGAEEEGLKGSQYYVNTLSTEQRQAVRFMLNLDMVGFGESWLLIGSRALQERGQEIAGEMGISARPQQLVGASSDHASFIDRRVPALMLYRSEDRLLHTPQDVVDRISPPALEEAVRLGLAFIAAFASS